MRNLTKRSNPGRSIRGSGVIRAVTLPVLAVFLALGSILVSACASKAAPSPGPAAQVPDPTAPTAPATASPAATYDWLQLNFDAQHSGNNTKEMKINTGNVAGLARSFQATLPDTADGAPVYLSGVDTASGTRDLLFVTTKSGDIVALDAHSGEQVWVQHNPAGDCRINLGSRTCYTTSSPVIDPNRQFVYSYGLDGKVHKYKVGDGTEITEGGWPQVTTLKGFNEKGSSAVAFATAKDGTTYLYMANSGYLGDHGDYQGHITTVNLADGSQNVFNANCSDQTVHFEQTPGTPDCSAVQTAIWARPSAVYDPDTDRIYVATGNGDFDPGQHNWGDSVLALNPNGTGADGNPLDSYTPADYQALDDRDVDLGSTAPAILPALPAGPVQRLAVQGGKDAVLRLLNMENLGGQGGVGHTGGEVSTVRVPQGGQVLSQPAVWVNPDDNSTWVFVANGNGISGLKLGSDANGTPVLRSVWQDRTGGFSPIVANNVLFYAGSGGIRALNPTDGKELWNDRGIGGIHWESPIVANGVLYITDESKHLTAYALP